MNKKLSRRDFLKLAGVTSTGLALSACGVKGTELPTTTLVPPTETIIPTESPAPTSTATPKPPAPTSTPTPKPPETLREYADALGIEIGGSTAIGYFQNWAPEPDKMKQFFLQNFNLFGNAWDELLNPYNPFRPSKATFDFSMMDLYADFLQRNKLKGQILLVWGNKANSPEWLLKGNFNENELLDYLENHIGAVMSRYKGRIQEYSVVNEILGTPWDKQNSFWYDHLNKNLDWVRKCFEWAYQADPNAILLLNDFGIEMPGTRIYYDDRNTFIYNLIRGMKDSGVPINGVGFQLHEYGLDFYPETRIPELMGMFEKNIRKYQSLGEDVYVTEFDLRLGGLDGAKDAKFALQGKVYGSILDTCLSAGVKSFTLFNLIDRLSWLESPENPPNSGKDADPCAWDDNYQPKPAYFAMMDVMKKHYAQKVR